MFALVSNDAVAVCAPLLPFASMRTPTSRKEPDWLFPPGNAGNVISTRELVVLSTAFVILANTPVAPSIRIGSCGGIAPPIPGPAVLVKNPTGDDVIGEGYVILNVVVVRGEFAIKAPDTRTPAPTEPGVAVCALLFV